MNQNTTEAKIEALFRKQVQKDKRVKNAYLLVHSEKLGVYLNIAEGSTGDFKASVNQPNHLASVGKLFTATLISILHERGLLNFNDTIDQYLGTALMNGLHIYRGKDYSKQITIRHLLMQTSGLRDVFFDLWKKMIANPEFRITPSDAVLWGKENYQPAAPPGKKHVYTDTNYYLLGLIIEHITGKPVHEAMHELIFNPLGMKHAYMHGMSEPKIQSDCPTARLYINGHDMLSMENVHLIDYAGGSVMAPLADFLTFMKALAGHKIIKKATLNHMIDDDIWMGFPTIGFNYGYSIWKFKSIPVILPETYYSWGCVGVTGAFLFYHPATKSILSGTFNDFSYRGKALEFMAKKVIKELLNYQKRISP